MTEMVTFRVYPGPRRRGLYVEVVVYATKAAMLAGLRDNHRPGGAQRHSRRVNGVCESFRVQRLDKAGRWRSTPCFARVNLYRRGLTAEIIAHEFGHAALAWAERKGLLAALAERDTDMTAEELVCYALGRMVNRFTLRARALRLW